MVVHICNLATGSAQLELLVAAWSSAIGTPSFELVLAWLLSKSALRSEYRRFAEWYRLTCDHVDTKTVRLPSGHRNMST